MSKATVVNRITSRRETARELLSQLAHDAADVAETLVDDDDSRAAFARAFEGVATACEDLSFVLKRQGAP